MSSVDGDFIANWVTDDERVLVHIHSCPGVPMGVTNSFEKAGPRARIFFSPADVHAAIVTCGGLCPGLNDVIRAIVFNLEYRYGVRRISGIRFGYRGLIDGIMDEPIPLNAALVNDIHNRGGTILGSSRGNGDRAGEIVDTLERRGIHILFTLGGDGTQRGAMGIAEEIARRNLPIAVVGVPKTIDNDIAFADRSFGFESAVASAVTAISAAHVEALGAPSGIGLVKVMGRHSGFIAAHATLAMNDVDFVLIPEVPFELDGPNGFLAHLEMRVKKRGHAVVLVAEGAGQHLVAGGGHTDASGNAVLGDVGLFLKDCIPAWFAQQGAEVNLKYIDPSYIIRATPANANDSLLCARLGGAAVHAAMCGRTKMLVNILHNQFVHIPIEVAVSRRNQVNPDGDLWRDVVEATGQPPLMRNDRPSLLSYNL